MPELVSAPHRRGKAKDVVVLYEDTAEFRFTGRISVFDKVIPSLIPFKGTTLAQTNRYWFEILGSAGYNTHYIGMSGAASMLVKKVDVVEYPPEDMNNRLVPLEFIVRNYVDGSFWDRIRKAQRGEIRPQEVGIPKSLDIMKAQRGDRLETPIFETTTKLERSDRLLCEEEALKVGGLSKTGLDEIRKMVLDINNEIQERVRSNGLIRADGKVEIAIDAEGRPMLVDTLGNADEDRFWDVAEYNQGRFRDLSKEFVRQYYRNISYHERLMKARSRKEAEPDIPELPDWMIAKTSRLYKTMFERITGRPFDFDNHVHLNGLKRP